MHLDLWKMPANKRSGGRGKEGLTWIRLEEGPGQPGWDYLVWGAVDHDRSWTDRAEDSNNGLKI